MKPLFGIKALCAAAALALAPLASAFGDGAEEPIPAAAFAELPFITDPLISPDGERVAARVTVSEQPAIAIFDAVGENVAPDYLPLGGREVKWYRWAGDRRLLVGYNTISFASLLTGIPTSRVLVHDLDSGESKTLGSTGDGIIGDDVIFVDPAGRYILLSAQPGLAYTPNVQRVDLSTGEVTVVERSRPGVWNWFADGRGVVRVGVDYGESQLKLYYRAGARDPMRRVMTRRYDRIGGVIESVHFAAGSERGLIVTNAHSGRFGLYSIDFNDDRLAETLFEHPEIDLSFVVMASDERVSGIHYEDERPRTHWLDDGMRAVQETVDGALPGKTNLILSQSRDGNRMIIWSSAADDPGTFYVFDRAARRLEGFASPFSELSGRAFAPVRPVRYTSRDGLGIRGYLTLPQGRPERALPLVLLPHGGPFQRDSWTFHPHVQFLASRGYAVFQPNFRGSTGYGRDFVERGHGQLGTGMIDDMEDGVDWLVGQGIVDPARVCIMGASYGGYAALWAATRNGSRYRCAISLNGPTDLRAMLRHDARSILPTRYMREWRRQIQGAQRSDLNAISPLRHAGRLSVPVLIAHGERDHRVPVAQSRDLVRALKERGVEPTSVFYPRAGHDFTRAEDSADFLTRVEEFLARHNPS